MNLQMMGVVELFNFKVSVIILVLSLNVVSISGEYDELFDLSINELMEIKLQTGSFLELDLMNSPFSMTVINKKQVYTSGARHLTELLEIYVPGFQYMYNKWTGEIWGMRGIAADRNTKFIFLINGHKMNTESRDGAITELNLGLLHDIERVEVLRGPAGLVYGSGAIAGIINVVTKKYSGKNKVNVTASLGTWDFNGTNQETQVQVLNKISNDESISFHFGYRKSDGIAAENTRLWGRPHWPYPQELKPEAESVPSAGSSWSTPGNWKIDMQWEYKNLKLRSRITHQVSNAGGMFVLDPWPNDYGNSDTTSTKQWVDGKEIDGWSRNSTGEIIKDENGDPVKSWWGETESWNTNRRQYQFDNVMAEISYDLPIDQNKMQFKVGFDGVTNRTRLENRRGFESFSTTERSTFVEETFGEKRFVLGALYLLNSIDKLQFAGGYEFRFDAIGNDLTGKNGNKENATHPIVSDVNYTNHALYFESLYQISTMISFHLGARYDAHTRTIDHGGVFTPKTAVLIRPSDDHSIKLMYQSSANNGSADNYEYNRFNFDNNGAAYSEYHFANPTEVPSANSVPIAGVSVEELHELKPEKVHSVELTSVHQFLNAIIFRPSISWTKVSELFVWNQPAYRVINSGEYEFINAEFDVSYQSNNITLGFNHTLQRLVNMDLRSQDEISLQTTFADSNYWEERVDPVTNVTTYIPVPLAEKGLDTSNAIEAQITVDEENFLNLATNLSKVYADINIVGGLMLHTDMRIFWGLPGRKMLNDADPQFEYLNIDTDPIVKWNASLHFSAGYNFRISAYVYDILAEPTGSNATHSIRWQQSANSDEHTDLYGMDLRSYAVQVSKNF
ncbi:MAG: TonB-dependent receptor plug domain-containing protein [Reichenbachiella sp.]